MNGLSPSVFVGGDRSPVRLGVITAFACILIFSLHVPVVAQSVYGQIQGTVRKTSS